MMKHLLIILFVVLCIGLTLFLGERRGREQPPVIRPIHASSTSIRAPGRIVGRTDTIQLRARSTEQIQHLHVKPGQWVVAGDVLLSLDAERSKQECELAAALLDWEMAKKERLENGVRRSEIETATQELQAAKARLDGAEKAYRRAAELSTNNLISPQTVDDLYAELRALTATAAAANARLQTLELPPRQDDLLAAAAAVRAAESRLRIAQISLDHAQIRAPCDARILAINAEVGELTGPGNPDALIVLSDTSRLRVVVEVDEFDALKVKLGQSAQIESDAADGILAVGKIVEIEPLMHAKQMLGQWAGERSDTSSRRVWVELDSATELPIGLPVDVYIRAN
ncbi:MAG: HlyD family efflux transporter periplasmic adaptor subunit [Pirellulaceae bacterium]